MKRDVTGQMRCHGKPAVCSFDGKGNRIWRCREPGCGATQIRRNHGFGSRVHRQAQAPMRCVEEEPSSEWGRRIIEEALQR